MNKPVILVVEDEALIAANLVETLSSLGYTVHEPIATGEDAINAVKNQKPDLVLMDIELFDEMNGIEAAEKIRAIADIPVVYLTANTDDMRIQQAQLTEPYGYILKPAHRRELKATIEMALYKHAIDLKLRESEEKFRAIFAAESDGIFIVDKESGIIIDCNDAITPMYGYLKDEVVGQPNTVMSAEPDATRAATQRVESFIPVRYHKRKDGRVFPVEITANVILVKGRDVIVAAVRDITKRKRVEDALRESEERLGLALNVSQMGTWDLNLGNHTAWRSLRHDQIFGYESLLPEWTYEMFIEHVLPEDRAEVNRRFEEANSDRHDWEFECRIRRTDGEIRWIWAKGRIQYGNQGEPVRMLGLVHDITERKRAEDTLRESEQRLNAAQRIAKVGDITWNVETGEVAGSDALYDLMQYDKSEKIDFSRVNAEIHHPDDLERVTKWLNDCIASGSDEITPNEYRIIRKDDKILFVHTMGVIHRGKGNQVKVFLTLQDITERKVAEEALEKESRMRMALLDNIPGCTAMILKKGSREIIASNRFAREIGAVPGKTCFNTCAMRDDNCPFCLAPKLWQTGQTQRLEVEYRGTWYEGIWAPLSEDLFVHYIFNISERKQAEEALRQSEERFNQLAEQSGTITWEVDAHGLYTYISHVSETVLGYHPDEMVGCMHYYDLHPESGREEFKTATFAVFEQRNAFVNLVNTVQAKDGRVVWVSTNGIPLLNSDGTLHGYRGSDTDITERKNAEEALRQSEERYRVVADFTYDWEYWIAPDGKFIYVSPSSERITGFRPEEFVHDQNLLVTITHTDDRHKLIDHLALLQNPDRKHDAIEFRITTRKGEERWIGHECQPVYNTNGEYLGRRGSNRDITQRKRVGEALNQVNKKLTLLSSITRHDINNQVTVLVGYLRILEKKQPDTRFTEYFQKVATTAQRISAMIQFTKEYEKIGISAPVWQECRTLVDTAVKETPLGKVLVKNDLPAGTEVFADPLVVKVCYNLMDNAVRYGGKITTIRFFAEESADDHMLVCEDDGDGVIAEEKERIFERGFGKNTGMGLFLAREILDITGITIRETGEPGKGARFEITVPKGAWRIAGEGA